MKSIVVYYSLEGNTSYAAGRIAMELGADLLRLHPVKEYPTGGLRKILWGGKSAVMSETPALKPYYFDIDSYDRVILGFPVWAANMAPPIRTFIRENDLSSKQIAAFACQSGSGADKAFDKLMSVLGRSRLEASLILIDPKTSPSDANERRIDEFCEKLK